MYILILILPDYDKYYMRLLEYSYNNFFLQRITEILDQKHNHSLELQFKKFNSGWRPEDRNCISTGHVFSAASEGPKDQRTNMHAKITKNENL